MWLWLFHRARRHPLAVLYDGSCHPCPPLFCCSRQGKKHTRTRCQDDVPNKGDIVHRQKQLQKNIKRLISKFRESVAILNYLVWWEVSSLRSWVDFPFPRQCTASRDQLGKLPQRKMRVALRVHFDLGLVWSPQTPLPLAERSCSLLIDQKWPFLQTFGWCSVFL